MFKVLIFIFTVFSIGSLEASELTIFSPYTEWAIELQKSIEPEFKKAGLNPRVYSRFVDFDSSMRTTKAPLVLSPSSLEFYNKAYSPLGVGKKKSGKTTQKFALYTNRPITFSKNKKYKVGLIQVTPLGKAKASIFKSSNE